VHNTFIQFGNAKEANPEKKALSTAPAWIGPSLQSVIAAQVGESEEPPREADAADSEWSSPTKLGSPKKVPVMRYSLSASSARAAGLPGSSAVVASYDPDCGCWPADLVTEITGVDPTGSPARARKGGQAEDDDEDGEDDEESGDEGVRPTVPLGELPSVGSAKHAEGLCKRCCFFPKGRCLNAYDCEFCHYEHEKRKRKKKKKGAKQKEDEDSEEDEETTGQPKPRKATAAGTSEAPLGQPMHANVPEFCPSTPGEAGFPSYGGHLPGELPWNTGSLWSAPPAPAAPSCPPGGVNAPGARTGLPLSAPPALPPRGLPVPAEPPPPAPAMGHTQGAADPYYSGQCGGSFGAIGSPTQAPGSGMGLPTPPGVLDGIGQPPGVHEGYLAPGYGRPGAGAGYQDPRANYSPYPPLAGLPGYPAAGLPQANGVASRPGLPPGPL